MKADMVKKEYRLQEWSGMLQSQKQSGLTVKQWCEEHGIRENAYYYRLRKVREAACTLLDDSEEGVCFAEVPFQKGEAKCSSANIRISFSGAVVEICSADTATLKTILKVLSHAE